MPLPSLSSCDPLDPADWEGFRAEGRRAIDTVVEFLRDAGDRPVWRSVPAEVRERLAAPAPRDGLGVEGTMREFRRDVLPYPYGNVHPRFWGWVNGSALPVAVLADLLASTLNPNTSAFDQAAVFVEGQVLRWLAEMLDFPEGGDGLLTSGCSMANLLALAAARSARAGSDVRRTGLFGGEPLTVYGSLEIHSSITKAVELLGIGSDHVRRIRVDADYRIDVEALRLAIDQDRAAGFRPMAVVGSAGTVNTGATDDLEALADLCEEEGLWLHVDGAFGVLPWLCPERRGELAGFQRADSLAFDLHKWMYLPSGVGCVLVRDAHALTRAFEVAAPYLGSLEGGLTAHTGHMLMNKGVELTRRFRALKVWMALKAHGARGFEEAIRANLAQARHLARRIEAHPSLELLAPAPSCVVCFRYVFPDASFDETNAGNAALLVRLQESGVALPSHTHLGGAFALRVAITNHRTRLADVDLLVDEVVRIGDELSARGAESNEKELSV